MESDCLDYISHLLLYSCLLSGNHLTSESFHLRMKIIMVKLACLNPIKWNNSLHGVCQQMFNNQLLGVEWGQGQHLLIFSVWVFPPGPFQSGSMYTAKLASRSINRWWESLHTVPGISKGSSIIFSYYKCYHYFVLDFIIEIHGTQFVLSPQMIVFLQNTTKGENLGNKTKLNKKSLSYLSFRRKSQELEDL